MAGWEHLSRTKTLCKYVYILVCVSILEHMYASVSKLACVCVLVYKGEEEGLRVLGVGNLATLLCSSILLLFLQTGTQTPTDTHTHTNHYAHTLTHA